MTFERYPDLKPGTNEEETKTMEQGIEVEVGIACRRYKDACWLLSTMPEDGRAPEQRLVDFYGAVLDWTKSRRILPQSPDNASRHGITPPAQEPVNIS